MARETVIGHTQSGALLVPGAVDYLAWTTQVAGFAGVDGSRGGTGEPLAHGAMSPVAKREFAARGWTVYENMLPPWQR